jgi:glutaconate CoA-transferase subunit B
LGVLVADARGELTLTAVHAGITPEQVKEATGWDLKVAAKVAVTPLPSETELAALRDLYARTAAAHGTSGEGE